MSKSRTKLAAVLPRPPTPRLALSIPEFCEAHGISEGFFYKLKKQGEGPREMKVGARTLITFESAAEWRAAREAGHPGIARPVLGNKSLADVSLGANRRPAIK